MRVKILLLLAVTLLLAAGAGPVVAGKGDDKLDGTWIPVSSENDGKAVPADDLKGFKMIIKGQKLTLEFGGARLHGTIKVDASKKPATLDLLLEDFQGKQFTILSIYELKGDSLKICGAEAGKDRPTEFSSKEGSKQQLSVYRREKS